ncbi:outer membrane lipoprotein chaperone LolA [Colwelliaceae bacterium 6441]
MTNHLTFSLLSGALSIGIFVSSFAYGQTAQFLNKTIQTNDEQTVSFAKQTLMDRLFGFEQFSAAFTQQVIDEEKNIIQEGQGNLAVKKPNLVYWQTTSPEETLIVSDGATLWFYDPFIEQASAYQVNASVADTPILLLTSTDPTLWRKYSVSQSGGDSFLIHSNDANSRVQTLELQFLSGSSTLKQFSLLDSTGQLSLIQLSNVDSTSEIEPSLFQFILPEGSDLDDQR